MEIKQLPDGPYDAQKSEEDILDKWLENKLYKPETSRKIFKHQGRYPGLLKEKRYTIINPPPNAYARPHMGNVSGYAYQDLFGRRARMQGNVTLLYPGKDHAAQQAEIVYTRDVLEPEGKKKTDFTREEFYNQAYEYFTNIMEVAQEDEKRVGLSADFDRDTFTLDPRIAATVNRTFKEMWEDRMVYKGVKMVNWSPGLNSAVADIDTERKTVDSVMHYLKYSLPEVDGDVKEMKENYAEEEIELEITSEVEIEDKQLIKLAKSLDIYHVSAKLDSGEEVLAWVQAEEIEPGMKLHGKVIGIVIPLTTTPLLIVDALVDADPSTDEYDDFLTEKEHEYVFKASNYLYGSSFVKAFPEKIGTNANIGYERGFIIGTVRPETKFGDTAIAVNPEDERFSDLIGKEIELEGAQGKVTLKVIPEKSVDMDFGTGMLKVTPAHAPTDYDIYVRYNFENPEEPIDYMNVIGKDSKLNHLAGKYAGKHAEDDRQEIAEEMKEDGYIVYSEPAESNISICERTKTTIQPIMSSQWFIDTDKLKVPALKAVQNGEIEIHPDYMTKKLEAWLKNLRDWPISRSIWWGYRIPVWYKGEVSETTDKHGHINVKIGDEIVEDMEDAIDRNLMKLDLRGEFDPILIPGRTAPEPSESYADIKKKYPWTQIANTGRIDQNYSDYEAALDKVNFHENSTVVAHSMGAAAISNYLIEKDLKVRNLIFLAPSLEASENFEEYKQRGFWKYWEQLPAELKKRSENLIIIYSNNDEHYTEEEFENFGAYIRAEMILEPGKGHFNTNKYRHDSEELAKILEDAEAEFSAENTTRIENMLAEGWVQDEDVFDTWFSSGQWPFATLQAEGLMEHYPTNLMETGYDILELWVSRMMMLGLYTQGELPFKHVYLHGLIKAEDGQKMSKSKGNIVYTEDIIDEYGADTLRMFYIVGNKAGSSYRVDRRKIKGYRNFLNKMWNGTRFVLQNLADEMDSEKAEQIKQNYERIKEIEITEHDSVEDLAEFRQVKKSKLEAQLEDFETPEKYEESMEAVDMQMLISLNNLINEVNKHFDGYRPGMAAEEIIQHYWHVFADIYVEQVKSRLYLQDREGNPINRSEAEQVSRNKAAAMLLHCTNVYLRLLHPFVPFVTEEIWRYLPYEIKQSEFIMYSRWPELD